MRFPCVYQPAKAEAAPPTPEIMETVGKFIEPSFKDGFLLSTEGCLPSTLGARVRSNGGSYTITGGRFTESKEIVGGFAFGQAKSKEEANEFTTRFLNVAGGGETDIRQLSEQPARMARPALAAK